MALALHQQGREVEATRWFERNRAACGPPGLYCEEYDICQRQLRGNLPQAFVHALMFEGAVRLARPWQDPDHAWPPTPQETRVMTVAPSGEQFPIAAGEHRATIVEVGGGVREYTVAGRDVLDPYPLDAMCDGAHGTPLIPWPNRLADGAYTFDGTGYQVALTEPDKNNAIHGFLRWRNWRPVEHEPDRVVMATRLHPLEGYPFMLDVQVEYTVSKEGLTVTTTAANLGDGPCPYGAGQHPYLSPGTGLVDECTLQLQAATMIDTGNDRQLPAGRKPTGGTPLDFAAGKPLRDQQLDFPFTDLTRDSSRRAWVRLTAADGSRVELWADDSYPIIELYTGDTLAPGRRRRGLGVEPMTCPPNAFQTGDGLRRLQPGQSVTSSWGVRLA